MRLLKCFNKLVCGRKCIIRTASELSEPSGYLEGELNNTPNQLSNMRLDDKCLIRTNFKMLKLPGTLQGELIKILNNSPNIPF